jgi:phosphoserine phosphatase
MNSIIKEFLNKLNPKTKKLGKYTAVGAGIGAVSGGVYGGVKGYYKITDADERVRHWEAKLANAKTENEKETSKEKLKHWKKLRRSIRIRNARDKGMRTAVSTAGAGAISGAVASGALPDNVKKHFGYGY